MKTIILAAGIGSRLGNPFPKPLTTLDNGRTIMANQLENLSHYVSLDEVIVVVGFKKELIIEAFPDLAYVYNERFDATNTCKSLLKGLRKAKGEDALFLNGDVVFDPSVVGRLLDSPDSAMAVNTASCGDEEVKYLVDGTGAITEVSKQVIDGLGEAVGLNLVRAGDVEVLVELLAECDDNDYFERGIELAIQRGARFMPVDISDLRCVEVDFAEDLDRANAFVTDGDEADARSV
jgi:choline kinase